MGHEDERWFEGPGAREPTLAPPRRRAAARAATQTRTANGYSSPPRRSCGRGHYVPLAAVAAEAGVGVGTLYRDYPRRRALLHALKCRGYGLLNQVLDEIDKQDLRGLQALREFLLRTLGIADQLVLPFHGDPPLISADAVKARRAMDQYLDRFIRRGHDDGSIRANVTAVDIIVFSSMTTQSLRHDPDSHRIAARQIAIFTSGLAASGRLERD
jgi:AcrR family transcriptional regulator